jgi:hypothetical protein
MFQFCSARLQSSDTTGGIAMCSSKRTQFRDTNSSAGFPKSPNKSLASGDSLRLQLLHFSDGISRSTGLLLSSEIGSPLAVAFEFKMLRDA